MTDICSIVPEFTSDVVPSKSEADESSNKAEGSSCIVRVALKSAEDALEWLNLFQQRTKTRWILKSDTCGRKAKTNPTSYTFNRDYLCHRSNARKVESSKKGVGCQAKLKIRIKKDSRFVQYRDSYAKRGLLGVIILENVHNHTNEDEESLRWLNRTNDTKQAFVEYFKAGLTSAGAIRQHVEMLNQSGDCRLEDKSVNPPKFWVYHTHNKWRKRLKKAEDAIANLKLEFHRVTTMLNEFKSEDDVCTAVAKLTEDLRKITLPTEFCAYVHRMDTPSNSDKMKNSSTQTRKTCRVSKVKTTSPDGKRRRHFGIRKAEGVATKRKKVERKRKKVRPSKESGLDVKLEVDPEVTVNDSSAVSEGAEVVTSAVNEQSEQSSAPPNVLLVHEPFKCTPEDLSKMTANLPVTCAPRIEHFGPPVTCAPRIEPFGLPVICAPRMEPFGPPVTCPPRIEPFGPPAMCAPRIEPLGPPVTCASRIEPFGPPVTCAPRIEPFVPPATTTLDLPVLSALQEEYNYAIL